MTAREIIKDYLIANGYDGLFYAGECGCTVDKLIPCGYGCARCEPGYYQKTPCGRMAKDCTASERETCEHEDCWDMDYDFMIGRDKPSEATDDPI